MTKYQVRDEVKYVCLVYFAKRTTRNTQSSVVPTARNEAANDKMLYDLVQESTKKNGLLMAFPAQTTITLPVTELDIN